MRNYKFIKYILPPGAIHLTREIVSLNKNLQKDIDSESALKEEMKGLSKRAVAVREGLHLLIATTKSKIESTQFQLSRTTENAEHLKDELQTLLQEQAEHQKQLLKLSVFDGEGAQLEENIGRSITKLASLKKRLRRIVLKSVARILIGVGIGVAIQGPLREKYIPLYIDWIKRSGFAGQVVGALSIATTGYLLYFLRSKARRIYATLELLFSLSAGWMAIIKIQTIGDTASFLQGAAAIYLFVRGFDNLTEGQRLLMERHDEHERSLTASESLAADNTASTDDVGSNRDTSLSS
ncbi:hypothetical protein HRD49_38345 [Corallococcus exiguus]|uniref:hypothetical protein n=1 Tax=Corallococcus exiguus TaxID=83462 RepID=UPI0015618CBD|nr:hypothetical protein [Corallococcus exiguus]NRD67609.1 hypothetical protein [Corallococcus exiguus]